MSPPLFLDANFRVSPCTSSLDWMQPYLHEGKNDLDSWHDMNVKQLYIYELVQAKEEEIFHFSASFREVIEELFWSIFFEVSRSQGKTHFITTPLEGRSTLNILKRFEEMGATVKIAPLDSLGRVDVEQLEAMISPKTALISMTMADGLTGVIQPFEEVGALAKKRGVRLHLEGSFAVGKLAFSFSEMDCDYLTFSATPLHAPLGGALFAKKGSPLFLKKGVSAEKAPLIALAAAAHQATLAFDLMALEVASLRDLFEKTIVEELQLGEVVHSQAMRLPNTTAFVFPKVHQEALLFFLDEKNMMGSIGGEEAPYLSKILMQAQMDKNLAQTAMSFSFSRMHTESQALEAAHLIREAVAILTPISEDLFP